MIRLAREVEPLLRVGLIRAEPVSVGTSGTELLGEMERTAVSLAKEHAGRPPSEIAGLGPARDLYRAFRIDPTRTRPSSEALLRRVIQGKPLPRISSAVDLCNLLSLQFLLPLGLYDAAKISGQVTLRRGLPGETYPGIRKEDVHLEGRPVLADAAGPFGNPTSDSLRTSVTHDTRSLWLMIFAPAGFPRPTLESYAAGAGEAILRHLSPSGGAAATEIEVLP
jgi:DNA/RNA-binding domain of Phe-tRNA-synthetase-like protein